jgi:hypothetical protein
MNISHATFRPVDRDCHMCVAFLTVTSLRHCFVWRNTCVLPAYVSVWGMVCRVLVVEMFVMVGVLGAATDFFNLDDGVSCTGNAALTMPAR